MSMVGLALNAAAQETTDYRCTTAAGAADGHNTWYSRRLGSAWQVALGCGVVV